jgi:hypothetical protein
MKKTGKSPRLRSKELTILDDSADQDSDPGSMIWSIKFG